MATCNPAYMSGVENELSLDHPAEKLPNKENEQGFFAITQRSKAMSKPPMLTWR